MSATKLDGLTTQFVPVANISWPKIDKGERTHDKDFQGKLGLSMEAQGLLEAIIVTPDAEKSGFYVGLAGKHRHGAAKDLRWELIEAKVIPGMSAEEAKLARIAENLWRNPLTKAQQATAITVWHDDYDKARKAYAAAVEEAKAATPRQKPGPKPKSSTPPQVQSGPSDEAIVEPAPLPPKPPANFDEHVSAITGQSPTTVKRQLKIGRAFTPAQIEIIEQMGISQTWQETIADLSREKRDAVMNLIASGMDEPAAIARVNETPEVKRADGKVYEVAPAEPGQKAENDMGDEEWVRFFCAETIALLRYPDTFISHAVLYRATREARQTLKTKVKKEMELARGGGLYSGFYGAVNRFLSIGHPSKWLKCGTCSGTGISGASGPNQKKCGDCVGNGFAIKSEGK